MTTDKSEQRRAPTSFRLAPATAGAIKEAMTQSGMTADDLFSSILIRQQTDTDSPDSHEVHIVRAALAQVEKTILAALTQRPRAQEAVPQARDALAETQARYQEDMGCVQISANDEEKLNYLSLRWHESKEELISSFINQAFEQIKKEEIEAQKINASRQAEEQIRKECADRLRTASVREYESQNDHPAETITLNNEQQYALKTIHAGNNVFLTGRAGTGKSTVVKKLRDSVEGMILLAPTGVAAVNIGGQTIHSFFELPTRILGQGSLDKISKTKIKLVQKASAILIDEISMVRADLLGAIDQRLKECTKDNSPFGGKQVVAVGDFAQLPPVLTNEEKSLYEKQHPGIFAFESSEWAGFKMAKLETVMRTKDEIFIEALNYIRSGNAIGLKIINKMVKKEISKSALFLTSTNKKALQQNRMMLNCIIDKEIEYPAEITGQMRKFDIPAEEYFVTKKGARVLVTANIYAGKDENRYICAANGDVGTVVEPSDDEIVVEIDRTKQFISIQRKVWECYEYKIDPETSKIHHEVIGSFSQFPLRLGWAITIHKSQGMTINNLCIDLKGKGCFAHGQLYVALSRATGLDGLYLTRKIAERDIVFDPKVSDWI
jgi:ATP-dependent DNA helicase PIF1